MYKQLPVKFKLKGIRGGCREGGLPRLPSIEQLKQLYPPKKSVGYFDDNFTAPVRRSFEHCVSLTSFIEPQHFADFSF